MTPDRTFDEIKADLDRCSSGDVELDHMKADNILREIALCSHLVTSERFELVKIYDSVIKWYA